MGSKFPQPPPTDGREAKPSAPPPKVAPVGLHRRYNVTNDFWSFLGDAIRERIGEENDSPDIEGTDEDRIKAFRAMVDAAIAAEEARKP